MILLNTGWLKMTAVRSSRSAKMSPLRPATRSTPWLQHDFARRVASVEIFCLLISLDAAAGDKHGAAELDVGGRLPRLGVLLSGWVAARFGVADGPASDGLQSGFLQEPKPESLPCKAGIQARQRSMS